MKDFNFDELDQAVSSMLQPKDSVANAQADLGAAGDSSSANVAAVNSATTRVNTVVPTPSASLPIESIPAAAPHTPKVVVKPRSSINRVPANGAKNQVVDIMAPSQRAPRQSAKVRPLNNGLNSAAPSVKPAFSVPKRTPTEDAALRWPKPGGAAEAPNAPGDTVSELTGPAAPIAGQAAATPQSAAASESKQPKPVASSPTVTPTEPTTSTAPAASDSFERFDSLSRHGFDFENDSTPPKPEADAKQSVTSVSSASTVESKTETGPVDPSLGRGQLDELLEQSTEAKAPPAVSSPFLTGAKVEKRPLGAYSPATSAVPALQPSPESHGTSAQPQPATEQVPAEQPAKAKSTAQDASADSPQAPASSFSWPTDDSFLSGEQPATAPEMKDAPAASTALERPTAPSPLKADSPKTEQVSQLEQLTVAETPAANPVKLDHLLSDGHEHYALPADQPPHSSNVRGTLDSIPQQYKVAQAPAEDTAHPIFDTKEYHAPVEGAPHKTGGNAFLVVALVVLLLAAAAAVGIYFFGDQLGF